MAVRRGAYRSACRAVGAAAAVQGARPDSAAGSPAAALPRSRELRLGPQQVSSQDPGSGPARTRSAASREKRMLSLRTHRGLPPLRPCLSAARQQLPPETRAHRYLPAHPRPRVRASPLPGSPAPAALSAPCNRRCASVTTFAAVVLRLWTSPAAHPCRGEVPLPVLSGLVHLGVARTRFFAMTARRGVHEHRSPCRAAALIVANSSVPADDAPAGGGNGGSSSHRESRRG